MNILSLILPYVAVAGGGGSGGGGGGDGTAILAAVTGIPSYYLGLLVKKLLPRRAELIVSATFASLVTVVLIWIGFYGGFTGFYIMAILAAGVWIGWSMAFFNVADRIKARSKKARVALDAAAQADAAWDEVALLTYAKSVFMRYQWDWSTFDLTSIMSYSTPEYAKHSAMMLRTLKELGRTNRVSNVEIVDASIVDLHDDADNTKDTVTIAFQAKLQDDLLQNDMSEVLYTRKPTIVEYWTFIRGDGQWRLLRIDQETARMGAQQKSVMEFAERNHMYYSLDMGWLFLPRRGVLFGKGKFGTSDIDNHVVGTYHDHLVQLYTYRVNDNASTHLIAQIAVPKNYGGIIIRRKKGNTGYKKTPAGYTQYTFEWPDFNERYVVHATHADRLATFELLNPAFMAYLYDTNSNLNIEVSDNTIYVYGVGVGPESKLGKTDAGGYEVMMEILMKAFKELKM